MKNYTRRDYFKNLFLAGGTALFSLSTWGKDGEDKKSECPDDPTDAKVLKKLLKVDSKKAKTLKYVADATTSKHKKYKAGQHCGICKFYTIKKEVEGFAPCTLAGNKYVSSCGWCNLYKLDKKKQDKKKQVKKKA